MTSQDFPYFDWGVHHNLEKNFYALVNSNADTFYLVNEDKNQLLQLHFILLASRHTMILNLSEIKNYKPGLIDNSVCLTWSLANLVPRMGNGSMSTFRTEFNTERLISKTQLPQLNDIEFQKNVFYLLDILNLIDLYIDQQTKYFKDDYEYFDELENYFSACLDHDSSAIDLVKTDRLLNWETHAKILNIKKQMIGILSQCDYNNTHEQVKQDLDIVNQVQSRFGEHYELIKSFHQHYHD